MLKKIVLGLVIVASFTGCFKNNDTNNTCNYDPCKYKAPASEIQAVQDYLTANYITATQHCSGIFYVIDDVGTGKTPTACSGVNVTYVGKLTDDSTFDEGTTDLSLTQVIPGWTNGIPLIKAGGKIHLYIPPSLGYGSRDYGPIPANSILVFDVTLNAVL
jgi:FKBP-type peptidyl-prolyl cis-trans isomerase FkpA